MRPARHGGVRAIALAIALASSVVASERDARGQGGAADVTPPQAIRRVDAVYPPTGPREEVDVVLVVTVGVEGDVTDVAVGKSGGARFDQAAMAAARQWLFVPASTPSGPVRAKIRVTFHFDPPTPPSSAISPQAGPSGPPAPVAPPTGVAPQVTPPGAPTDAPSSIETDDVNVRGHSYMPSRGGGDHEIPIGKLANVPRADAAGLLRLAPGVFLTNEGGTGHPYQIFLRGFDAREGQDIEMTIDGMPINEVGNPHGNGLSDTHFIIPEVVSNLRVIEGPFAPQQGNFAVAGSALYDVGLAEHGFMTRATYGSFKTRRLFVGWRPIGANPHTFGAGEVFASDGFGDNRKSERATAMGGYEGRIGKEGLFRLLAGSYATHYGTAGVLRDDDVVSGRKSFYSTYDNQQGGDSQRHFVNATVQDKVGTTRFSQQVFLSFRDYRIRQNFTGFVDDPQQPWQTPHSQRGDLVDQRATTVTFGGRGSARDRLMVLGQPQELELGYFARYDDVSGVQQRDRSGTNVPYRTDLDLDSGLANLGLYADASLRPGIKWITLRGGARVDYFNYRVHDRCAQRTQASIGGVPADTECFTSDRAGYRSPDQTASTSAALFQPRATVLLGPFGGFTFNVSHGLGARSIDPQYINQDLRAPFAEVTATEGGVALVRELGSVDLLVKSIFFETSVDHDLFFNQTEGRNTLANGTTRTGWAGNVRATGSFFDIAGSVTLVRAVFDDTHLLIPYAPASVVRTDGSLFGDLPIRIARRPLVGNAGLGVSFVSDRPLPFGERSDSIFTVDLAGSVRWRGIQFGITCTNLFDRKYRLGEYNYASDFRSRPYPTLVAARHFVAGEPRAVYGTLTLYFGGGSNSDDGGGQ